MTESVPSPRARLTVLVAIAYYGTRNEAHVRRLIKEYQSMSFTVDVVILTEQAKAISGVEQRIGLPISDPWSLPFAYQTLFDERRGDYDVFIYTEDDTLITERSIKAFLDATATLPPDKIAGFLRIEERSDGTLSCSTVHNHYHWVPDSAFRIGNDIFATFSNPHSGSFILTKDQLNQAIESGGFFQPPRAGRFDMLVTAATVPYTSCGMSKVVCVSRLNDFLLPHLTNKYVDMLGLPLEEVQAQTEALAGTLEGKASSARLFNPTTRVDDGRWDKRFYEPVDQAVIDSVPTEATNVLSVGTGSGALEAELNAHGHDVLGIPIDNIIGVTASRRGVQLTAPELARALASVSNRSFDAVVLARALHHFSDPAAVLREVISVAAPGATIVASFPNLRRHRLRALRYRSVPTVPQGDFDELGVHLLSQRKLRRLLQTAGVHQIKVRFTPTRWGAAGNPVAGEQVVLIGLAPDSESS